MNAFEKIKVEYNQGKHLVISNPTDFPLIGQGRMGAVFKLDESKCIKIFADPAMARQEQEAYARTMGSPIMPVCYESGDYYIIIEYIQGPNLKEHLQTKGYFPEETARELVGMLCEMKKLGFLRWDESLRHILLKDGYKIKIIDHYYAFTLCDPYPVKLLKQLDEIGMMEPFLEHVRKLCPTLYDELRPKARDWRLKSVE